MTLRLVPPWLADQDSWVIELASGALTVVLVLLIALLARFWWGLAIAATGFSLFYEREEDPNGFSWTDVAQRSVGIILAIVAWAIAVRS